MKLWQILQQYDIGTEEQKKLRYRCGDMNLSFDGAIVLDVGGFPFWGIPNDRAMGDRWEPLE